MENNRNRRKSGKPFLRTVKVVRKNSSNEWVVRACRSHTPGFASSAEFITAVSKIYHQEENDIEKFLKFAESYKAAKAK
jgi:hypothetical protein